jgi:hypothetical protein
MAKVCFYHPERRCFWSCCSFVDEFGNVQVHDCVRSELGNVCRDCEYSLGD